MSGWFNFRCQTAMKDKSAIFMYHRVLPKEQMKEVDIPIQPGMYVSPKSLRLHISYLKTHFSLISLTELVRRLQDSEDISRCVVLTFDDGWLDNYLYAFPILQEFKVPATIFLTSGFIGTTRLFWPEEIGWAVLAAYRGKIDSYMLPEALLHFMKRKSYENLKAEEIIDRIITEMKLWDEPRRLPVIKICAQLRKRTAGESKRVLMNWNEVREMAESGLVSFGSHTVSHALLNQLPLKNVRQELIKSVAKIHKEAETTGMTTNFFAYPNGNYTSQVLAMLAESGITAAVTTKRGLVDKKSFLFELPRVAIHDDISHTQALFQWRLFVR
jgi:peptidoglycan/xylan/chitin deacetylase (PgdA/CDA1 family)